MHTRARLDQASLDALRARMDEYEKKHKPIAFAYGGDGTVLDVVRATGGRRAVIPVRDYGLCGRHAGYLESILDGTLDRSLKLTLCPFVEYFLPGAGWRDRGIAEVAVKNVDPTCALRFDFLVDGKPYMKNVVADGIVASTAYGSTGYFKSVARCVFRADALGVAFIAPTQGVNNVVLDGASVVEVEFVRPAEVVVTADKSRRTAEVRAGDRVRIGRIPDQVSVFGLDEFHCQECRALRHSIVERGVAVQDQYAV